MGPNIMYLVIMISLGIIFTPCMMAGFGYFLGSVHQYNTAIWLFISTITSIAGLHLNILLFRKKIDEWYDVDALEQLKLFGLFVAGSSLVASGYYLTKAIVDNDKAITNLESFYGSSAAAGLSLFLGCWFFYLCKWNKRYVELCNPQLAPTRNGGWRPFE